jgi:hypothetical protein
VLERFDVWVILQCGMGAAREALIQARRASDGRPLVGHACPVKLRRCLRAWRTGDVAYRS